ncbi:MAG: hypothetical protein AAGC95_05600 [Pseudomonadota bacterium]
MDFQISNVVKMTLDTTMRNIAVFSMLAALLVGAPIFLLGLLELGADPLSFGVIAAISTIVNIVATYILQGAIIHGAVNDFNGRPAQFNESLATGLRHAVALFIIAILMTIGLALGFMLLIVPGVILAVMWAVAIPARVIENAGVIGSFGRSRELTKGFRWKIFLLYLIIIIATILIGVVVLIPAVVFSAIPGLSSLAELVLSVIATIISSVLGAVGASALYFELRRVKEGIGAEQLASVFE